MLEKWTDSINTQRTQILRQKTHGLGLAIFDEISMVPSVFLLTVFLVQANDAFSISCYIYCMCYGLLSVINACKSIWMNKSMIMS